MVNKKRQKIDVDARWATKDDGENVSSGVERKLFDLPIEIILLIVEFLCFKDVWNFSCVCKAAIEFVDEQCIGKAIDRSPLNFASPLGFHCRGKTPFHRTLFNRLHDFLCLSTRIRGTNVGKWRVNRKFRRYIRLDDDSSLGFSPTDYDDCDQLNAISLHHKKTPIDFDCHSKSLVLKSMQEAASTFFCRIRRFDDEQEWHLTIMEPIKKCGYILIREIQIVTDNVIDEFEWTSLLYHAYRNLCRIDREYFGHLNRYQHDRYFICVPDLHKKIFLHVCESYRRHQGDERDYRRIHFEVAEAIWTFKQERYHEKNCTLYQITIRSQ